MQNRQKRENGRYCMNESCEEYQKKNPDSVIRYGKTEKGVQRYRCMTCKKTFTETKGTMMYRLRHSEEEIRECIALIGDRNSLAAIHRIKGRKEETVCRWLKRGEKSLASLEEQMIQRYTPKCIQIDASWSFVDHKGEKGGEKKKRKKGYFGVQPSLT
jgi:transposase-like protein